jgi:predicted ArsR family transcriptional regulator
METLGTSGTARSILNSLKRRGTARVVELSEEFGMSGMAVRHHLASLRAKGLVASTHERRGVGRPTELFRLTEHGDELFPRHYDQLASDILETITSVDGKEKTDQILGHRKQRQLDEHGRRLQGLTLDNKVSELARILTEEGYLAESAQHGDGYVLTEHNCAVSKVAQQFQQVCECEMHLIAELLDAEVIREQYKMAGDSCCSYVIKPKAGS